MRSIVPLILLSGVASADGLQPVDSFGANPGALKMYEYVPATLGANRPLVVALHGCTQQASDYLPAGWNTLADQYGFAVVYPEQQTANNQSRCFNWAGEFGDPANLVRAQGENESIIEMIDHAIAAHGLDPTRVYVTGLSAGGAFTSVMMATWPERFAAGAIFAGIPYRCATTLNEAFTCTTPGIQKSAEAWGDLVRGAADGPWPRVQIWQGSSDFTVAPMNAGELVEQWTDVHGISAEPSSTETTGKATLDTYGDFVERYTIAGMGHAVPIDSANCPSTSGTYFSDQGICATQVAAKFFGLTEEPGGGGGGGGGGGDDDEETPTKGGCSTSGGSGVAMLLLGLLALRRRR